MEASQDLTTHETVELGIDAIRPAPSSIRLDPTQNQVPALFRSNEARGLQVSHDQMPERSPSRRAPLLEQSLSVSDRNAIPSIAAGEMARVSWFLCLGAQAHLSTLERAMTGGKARTF